MDGRAPENPERPDATADEAACDGVLLSGPSGPEAPRAALERVPRARAWSLSRTDDDLEAMARLCLQHVRRNARRGWGLARPAPLQLVLGPDVDESARTSLLDAIERHLPDVACWATGDEGLEPLAGPTAASLAPTIETMSVARDGRPAPRDRGLRLVGAGPGSFPLPPEIGRARPDASEETEATDADATGAVTRDELDLLLGHAPPAPAPREDEDGASRS